MAKRISSKEIRSPRRLSGVIKVPGDKSISHRAAIIGSIVSGHCKIANFSPGHDCLSTIRCLKALGARITSDRNDYNIVNIDSCGFDGLNEPENVLNAGNSGTTMRLLCGILAAKRFTSIITGDSSLRSRPMKRIIEPLRLMGAEIYGRCNDSYAPLIVRGNRLHGISYNMSVPSAQVKSAILLAGLFADSKTIINQTQVSRDHTERFLVNLGVNLKYDDTSISIHPLSKKLKSPDIMVPGDISSAAFWMIAAAIHPEAEIKIIGCGVNPTRTGVLDILVKMGAKIKIENQRLLNNEPVADIIVESSHLEGVEIGGEIIPRLIDEIPILAVASCFATGNTIIRDAGELRNKESDRIMTTIGELTRLGAKIEPLPDGMLIRGSGKLVGNIVNSHADHRLAMSLAIAGIIARGKTIIERADCVAVSYPDFWSTLKLVSGS